MLISSIFLLSLSFSLDFYHTSKQLRLIKEAERQKCESAYISNKCAKITLEDGPEINKSCLNFDKCKRHENAHVFGYETIITMIKNSVITSFDKISFTKSLILVSFGLIYTYFKF